MQILYHHPICPLSRQILVLIRECAIECGVVKEEYWLKKPDFVKMSPSGVLPILALNKDHYIVGYYPIIEYIKEVQGDFYLMPNEQFQRAETRRLIHWCNEKFYREVSKILIDEKMIRLLMRLGQPRSDFLRAAKSNLNEHLKYLNTILEKKGNLVSDKITCADLALAAQLSTVDYFGEINWDSWHKIKEWYLVVKSRPSFKPILEDRIPGFTPPKDYSNLDF